MFPNPEFPINNRQDLEMAEMIYRSKVLAWQFGNRVPVDSKFLIRASTLFGEPVDMILALRKRNDKKEIYLSFALTDIPNKLIVFEDEEFTGRPMAGYIELATVREKGEEIPIAIHLKKPPFPIGDPSKGRRFQNQGLYLKALELFRNKLDSYCGDKVLYNPN